MKRYRDKQGHFAVRPKLVKAVAKALDVKPEEVVKVVDPPLAPAHTPIKLEWHDDVPLDTTDLEAPHHSPKSEGESWKVVLVFLLVVGALAYCGWVAYKASKLPDVHVVVEPSIIATAQPTAQPSATVDADDYSK